MSFPRVPTLAKPKSKFASALLRGRGTREPPVKMAIVKEEDGKSRSATSIPMYNGINAWISCLSDVSKTSSQLHHDILHRKKKQKAQQEQKRRRRSSPRQPMAAPKVPGPRSKSGAASYKLQSHALGTRQVSSTASRHRLLLGPAIFPQPGTVQSQPAGQGSPCLSYPANQDAQSPGVAALVQICCCP